MTATARRTGRRARHHTHVSKPKWSVKWHVYCGYCGHTKWYDDWHEALVNACAHSWILK